MPITIGGGWTWGGGWQAGAAPTLVFLQNSKLVGTGDVPQPGEALQGYSVALSSCGGTLAVGSYGDNSSIGATWVFTRSGNTWSQQGSKLVGTGYSGASAQGSSVALSSCGNTLAIGGVGDCGGFGATWVFTRSGTTWSQQGCKLIGTGGAVTQGQSVSLSADGNTLAIGGYVGCGTWIFTRSGTTWSQQGGQLTGTGVLCCFAYQGFSVALSSCGNTLAVGGYADNCNVGATWVFTRSGTTWSQQGCKLIGTGATTSAWQGYGVSLNSNGNILAVGGIADGCFTGATWVFTRSGTAWSQQGSKLVGVGSATFQGSSVSLNDNGNILAVGGKGCGGATWIFSRSGTAWSQQGCQLVGTCSCFAQQGFSVALSKNGSTLAVGGPYCSITAGATWIFEKG
jgi:hypothetical protein